MVMFKMKRTVILLFTFVCIFFIYPNCTAFANDNDRIEDIAGADEILSVIPDEAREYMSITGIDDFDGGVVDDIQGDRFISSLIKVAQDVMEDERLPISMLIGIILLCALASTLKNSLVASEQLFDIVAVLCVSVCVASPIASLIDQGTTTITDASSFMKIYIPIMAGLMVSSGQTVSAGSYYTLMMTASQLCSLLFTKVILPAINIFYGVSIASSISPQLNLSSICNMLYKGVKWFLGFSMSIFASLFTIQGIIGTYSDSVSSRAMKFAVKSFVPVVGGALSDVYLSVVNSVKMLKSGVGVVAIIAAIFIFVPILFKCLLWLFMLNLCNVGAEIFNLRAVCVLFSVSSKVLSCFVAVIFSIMSMFVISTAIILLVGVQ